MLCEIGLIIFYLIFVSVFFFFSKRCSCTACCNCFGPPHCSKLNQARYTARRPPSDLRWGCIVGRRHQILSGGEGGCVRRGFAVCNHWFCNKQPTGEYARLWALCTQLEPALGRGQALCCADRPPRLLIVATASSHAVLRAVILKARSNALYWRVLFTPCSTRSAPVFPSLGPFSIIGCCSWWRSKGKDEAKTKMGAITGGTCSPERSTGATMRGRRIGAGVLHCWEKNTVWLWMDDWWYTSEARRG